MSYPPEKPEVLAGVIAMSLKTISTYPILLFCGREAFYTVVVDVCDVVRGRETNPVTDETSLKWRLFIGLPWFFVSLILAIQIPNIGEVIGFLGSLASVFIFIFPGMCLFQVYLFLLLTKWSLLKDENFYFFR
jgi:sodium-coupled neutral amino acid transporter 7/8